MDVKGKRVLVTGATGFIGARLVQMLAAEGAEVVAPVRSLKRAGRIAGPGVRALTADLSDGAALAPLLEGCAAVFALAYDFRRPPEANVALHRALADACERSGVRRFVHVSSIAAYDGWPSADLDESCPRTTRTYGYKAAKVGIEADLERRFRAGALEPVTLEPTIVYGPGSGQWTDMFARVMRRGAVVLPRAAGRCNGVYVDDVARALIAAATTDAAVGEAIIVNGPEPFPWSSLLQAYADALGRPEALRFEDRAPTGRPASLLQRVQLRLGLPITLRPADANPGVYLYQGLCSTEKLTRLLGPPEFPLEKALPPTQAYLRKLFTR